MEDLINKFNPLLKKYSYLLYLDGNCYEDAYQELCLHLIEVIHKIPLDNFLMNKDRALINYISLAIKNKYIHISRKNQTIRNKNITVNDNFDVPYDVDLSDLFLQDFFKDLSSTQREVMILSYIYKLSDKEIAKYTRKTRQAINRSKSVSINKLRKYIKKDNILN